MNSYRNGFENRIDPVGFLATEPNLDDALFVLHEQSHSLAPELPLVRRPARFSYHTGGRAGLTVENRDVPLRIRRVLQHLQGSSFGIIARYCATHPCKYLKINGNVGGESGIRTLALPLDCASCRFHNARVAVDANDAVAPCTGLHRKASLAHALEPVAVARMWAQ